VGLLQVLQRLIYLLMLQPELTDAPVNFRPDLANPATNLSHLPGGAARTELKHALHGPQVTQWAGG